jgi:hypothetical protein
MPEAIIVHIEVCTIFLRIRAMQESSNLYFSASQEWCEPDILTSEGAPKAARGNFLRERVKLVIEPRWVIFGQSGWNRGN